MTLALTIIHCVISLVLIAVVLMQHGKQQGLSGAIAGGAETFFGKNKGRTIDSMLKKFTAVIAVLFIISSLALTAVSVKDLAAGTEEATATEEVATEETATEEAATEEAATEEAATEEAATEEAATEETATEEAATEEAAE